MKDYLLILLATLLLAINFTITKLYQKKSGTAATAGLYFSAACGLFTAVIFFAVNGFRFSFSPFSALMALGMALCVLTYTVIGFRILKEGNMATYTLFLMSGGMVLPYLYGLIFLNEPFSWLRMAGLAGILFAIVLMNLGSTRLSKSQLFLCAAVFIINGFTSIVTKAHQIDTVHGAVDTSGFVVLAGIAQFLLSSVALLFARKKERVALPSVKMLPLVLCSAAVSGVSSLLQLGGAKNLPATVLYPFITGGTIIFSTLAGMLCFREKVSLRQWVSILLCFIGTCLFL